LTGTVDVSFDAGLSEQTAHTYLDWLQVDGCHLTQRAPDIVATRIKRADRRPQGGNLNLVGVRDDLDANVAVLEHQYRGQAHRGCAAVR
jgi:hypothetical protein